PGALVMHPAPINRGVEISSVVADSETTSLLREQVHCGVLTRMAVLDMCLGGGRK
ncbi:MAG: aspartate carbamoyltransferase catalytic subunit, partial [Pyramidobacter sp.]|nr:aspartate carbamoyltransferase catalytic subunit [Pyramidobacter sp.]